MRPIYHRRSKLAMDTWLYQTARDCNSAFSLVTSHLTGKLPVSANGNSKIVNGATWRSVTVINCLFREFAVTESDLERVTEPVRSAIQLLSIKSPQLSKKEPPPRLQQGFSHNSKLMSGQRFKLTKGPQKRGSIQTRAGDGSC